MGEELDRAFPLAIRSALASVLPDLPTSEHRPSGSIVKTYSHQWPEIKIDGETVIIPSRIYKDPAPPGIAAAGSPVSVAIDCLYTRHHDGWVRQRALARVLESTDPWVIPFVIQLLGEYVAEICEDIERFAREVLPERPSMAGQVRVFANENPDFIVLTRQRAASYWDCYYRRRYPNRETYPGLRALDLMTGPS